MFILQVSDMHIKEETELTEIKQKITSLGDCLEKLIEQDEQLLCCLLGDFIDSGNAKSFSKAKDITNILLDRLSQIVREKNFAVELVPGNHDLCGKEGEKTLTAFNTFASELLGKEINFLTEKSIYKTTHFGYHFIAINTALHGQHQYGSVALEELSEQEVSSNTILLTHHALISADKEDSACIRNGFELQTYLEKHQMIAMLHGHTHGCKRYTVGRDSQVIGVGPMFKDVTDVSNQCNLIHVTGNAVRKIQTLIYQGDRKEWDVVSTYEKKDTNDYYGSSIFDVYTQVVKDTEATTGLQNLKIQIRQTFKDLEEEIQTQFRDALERARDWQEDKPPSNLTYTHGELMNNGDVSWSDFVVKTLQQNSSSKRVIIPLIKKEAAFQGGDGQLVSFDVVQFGFHDSSCSELYITVYFRALEVRNFLPINLCEAYLMAKKIRAQIQTINKVAICFFAFRAEAKQNYGCYRKAQIDLLTESQLCKIIQTPSRRSELTKLLEEKANMGDTVIETAWLEKLNNALEEYYEDSNRNEVFQRMDKLSTSLKDLRIARGRCSDYSKTQVEERTFTENLIALKDMLCGDKVD